MFNLRRKETNFKVKLQRKPPEYAAPHLKLKKTCFLRGIALNISEISRTIEMTTHLFFSAA